MKAIIMKNDIHLILSPSSVSHPTPKPTNESGKPVDKKAAGLEGGVKGTMLPTSWEFKKRWYLDDLLR